jgi:hypothetical protein
MTSPTHTNNPLHAAENLGAPSPPSPPSSPLPLPLPTPHMHAPVLVPTPHMHAPVLVPTPHMHAPVLVPTPHMHAPVLVQYEQHCDLVCKANVRVPYWRCACGLGGWGAFVDAFAPLEPPSSLDSLTRHRPPYPYDPVVIPGPPVTGR